MRPIGAILTDLRQRIPPPGAAPAPEAAPGVCPQCGGCGLLRQDVPLGHPLFGTPVACSCTTDRARARAIRDLVARGHLAAFAAKTFATFACYDPAVQPLYHAAWHFASHLQRGTPPGWLLLQGSPGCGKTHLAAAIANAAVAAEVPAYFAVVPDLLDAMRGGYERGGESLMDQLDLIRTVDLLVLDDLGAENPTAWAREKLYQIVNARYNARAATVFTMNLGLEHLDPRLASRLSERPLGVQVYAEAPDYRWTGGPP